MKLKPAPLKIALLVSDIYANQYIRDLFIRLRNDSGIELTDLIVVNSTKKKSFMQHSCFFLFRVILVTERLFLFRNKKIVNHIVSHHDISSLFKMNIRLTSNEVVEAKLDKLAGTDIDLIIKLGDEIEKFSNLERFSKVGLISANFTPEGAGAARLAGFWEVFYKQNSTIFSVYHILKNGSKVGLLQCLFQTRYCFLLNKSFLYKKSGIHFYNFIQEVAKNRHLQVIPKPIETLSKSKSLYTVSIGVVISYLFKTWIIVLKKIVRSLQDGVQWHSVIYNKSFNTSLVSEPRIMPNPIKRILADPFLIEHESKTYCFVEDFEYRAKRGKISCFEVYDNKFSDISVCLEETFHLSFPFVFKYNNELYMCPETCDSDQIRVYKAVNFPFEWKLEKVIMDNVRAADTLLFEKEGKWWMLTNIDPSRIGDNSSELYLFYSNSPLSTEWTPHKLNPIYVDATKARNGGIIIENNTVYRVAQKQEFDKYGASVGIYRIDEITVDTYVENFVSTIEANYIPDILGTHHMSGTSHYTALDFYDLRKY